MRAEIHIMVVTLVMVFALGVAIPTISRVGSTFDPAGRGETITDHYTL